MSSSRGSQSLSGGPELNMFSPEDQTDNVIIIHSNTGHMADTIPVIDTQEVEEEPSPSVIPYMSLPSSPSHLQPQSYVTQVTVSSMCLCCSGQQARRCSVNIGEALTSNLMLSCLVQSGHISLIIQANIYLNLTVRRQLGRWTIF